MDSNAGEFDWGLGSGSGSAASAGISAIRCASLQSVDLFYWMLVNIISHSTHDV